MKSILKVALVTYLMGVFVSIGILVWSIVSPRTYIAMINKWVKRICAYT